MGFWQSRALAVAAELKLADVLADGPVSLDELAHRTGAHAPSLYRLLRALESVGIFSQVSPGVFANTPGSECLRKDHPESLWAFVRAELSAGGGFYEAWTGLHGSVKSGRSAFEQAYGYSFWEFSEKNPAVGAIFNDAMNEIRKLTAPAITDAYDWSKFPVIVDIGGGLGGQLVDILKNFPSCRGILFDRPEAVARAISHARMEHVAGDFFKSVPGDADAYILRGVIHDWPDAQALALLGKLRESMKKGAKVVILEEVIPETPEFTFGKWLDLVMLTCPGGRERTEGEYRELLSAAGFQLEEVLPAAGALSILVAEARDAA